LQVEKIKEVIALQLNLTLIIKSGGFHISINPSIISYSKRKT